MRHPPRLLATLAGVGLALAGPRVVPLATAQTQVPSVTQYIVDLWQEGSGLPQNYVLVVLQTRDGYVWVGTRGGVSRFDGVRFTTYDDHRPGQLKDSEVWALAEDDEGALWIGTYGGGLSRLSGGRFTTYGVGDGLPSDMVTALAKGPDGRIWIGTTAGLAVMDRGRITAFQAADGLPRGAVRSLLADRHRNVWIGTDGGLARFTDGRFVDVTASCADLLTGQVTALAGDVDDGIWLAVKPPGTVGDGLRRLQGGAVTRFTMADGLPADIVMSVAVLPGGTVWAGTRQGLARFDGARFETYFSDVWGVAGQQTLERVAMQGIPALAADREGNLWFGTRLDGLGRMRVGLFTHVTGVDASGQGIDVRTLVSGADDTVWLGTSNSLKRLQGTTVTTFRFGGTAGHAVDAMTFDRDGTLLLGSDTGLWQLRGETIEPHPLDAARRLDIALLFTDSRGGVWIGTRDKGAVHLADGKLTVLSASEGLLGNQVRGLAEDRAGGIWIGTRDGGVSRLHRGRLTTFGTAQGLSGPSVQAICVDRDDTAWVATRTGLNRIRGNRVTPIRTEQGLPSNYFYQIVEDESGDLWLTYAQGVTRISRAELDAVADGRAPSVHPTLFGADTGMICTTMTLVHQPTVMRTHDGRLWFATSRTVEVIDPRFTIRNSIPPPVLIEDLSVDRVPRPTAGAMTIEPTRGEVAIHYTALSFVAPGRVRFKYLLEGFDDRWIEAGTRRVAYYSNLPHGSYRFRVIACNNDGVWNQTGATMSLTVLPRWHERASVRALAVALLGLAILGAYRRRIAKFTRTERELSARVGERTRALQELTAGLEERVSDRTAELRRANEALSAERERLAVTLASIGDGVIATDVDSRIVLMNRVAEQITAWTAPEAAGLALSEVFRTTDRDTRAPLPDPASAVLRGDEAGTSGSARLLQTRDGRDVLVADSVAPIRDPEGRVVGAVFVFRDVTERERIDDQLRNAQRLEALGVLAGGIAHDFNNLLTGVFGYIDLARNGADDPEQVRETTGRALDVLDKARGLTGQLLTFSKAGEPVRRLVNLGPLVRSAVSFVLSGSNVVAELDVPPGLWPCNIDERQVGQVVDNLVINARQAMPSGGTVTVQLANSRMPAHGAGRPGGPGVRLTVRDHGPGIPRELRSRVLEPFFTTKPKGSGLGLATAYSIVHRHGGHLEIESEEGAGAAFHVILPASPEGIGLAASESVSSGPAEVAAGARILVMDDEPHVRDVAVRMLRRLGYEAIPASDDREAVAILKEAAARGERVDAAILDVTIPGGLGGADALSLLRDVVPGLPAVASSGYSGDSVMARPTEHGFTAALPKPYTMGSLRAVMAEVLGARGIPRA